MFDTVVALVDLPSVQVKAGAVGTIVEIYPDGEFEIEFEPDADENLVTVAMRAEQIRHRNQFQRAA